MTRNPLSWILVRKLGARLPAVDALRGLAVGGMILVNHPGPTGVYYAPLVHAHWDGWTLADTIFPAFLFIVGVSIALSLSDAEGRTVAPSKKLYFKILRRGAILFLLNVALINFPYYELATLKLTGTLTRIALCSVAGALLFLNLGWRSQVALLVTILFGHWLLIGGLGVEAVRAIDQTLLGTHFRPDGDSGLETLATTAAATTSTLFGTLCGRWLRSHRRQTDQAAGLLATGFTLYVVGSAWGWILPINRDLYSSSFATLMAGLSMMTLGLLLWTDTRPSARPWLKPLQIAGLNALVFYLGAQSLQRLLVFGKIAVADGSKVSLRQLTYDTLFGSWVSGALGSLLFALTFLLVCYAVVYALYRARIFVKL